MNSLYGLTGSSNRVTGLASGMDIDGMVLSMTATSRARIDAQYQSKQKLLWRQDEYRKSISSITNFRNNFMNVGKADSNMLAIGFYNSSKINLTGTSVRATATSTAPRGDLKFDVKNLATAQKVTSADGASFGIVSEIPSPNGLFLDDHTTSKEINLQLELDGVKKTVSFKLDDHISLATDTAEIYANLEKNFQEALNKTFSNDPTKPRVGVKITSEGQMELVAAGNSKLFVASSEPTASGGADNTSNNLLGLVAGTNNRLSTSKSLGNSNFKTQLQGNDFRFSINGVDFSFTKEHTVQEVMSTVNASKAGVKLEYSQTTDKFTLTAKDTGTGDSIALKQTHGNLLTSLFGSAPGTIVGSGKMYTQNEEALNGFDLFLGDKLAGSAFNLTVDGVTKTIRLPALDKNGNNSDTFSDPKKLMAEVNRQIYSAFGSQTAEITMNEDESKFVLSATNRSSTFKIENSKDDSNLVRAMGFYNGQENNVVNSNTSLKSLGIQDGSFSIKGEFVKDGKSFSIDQTINIDTKNGTGPQTLGELLKTPLGEGATLGDLMSMDAETGALTLDYSKVSNFEMKDGTSNLTSKLFASSDLRGYNTTELGVFSGGLPATVNGDGDPSILNNILTTGAPIDWDTFPGLSQFDITIGGTTKTITLSGKPASVQEIVDQLNSKIETAFGTKDVQFTYDKAGNKMSLTASASAAGQGVTIAKKGTDTANNILSQIGFMSGTNSYSISGPTDSTKLADLGFNSGADNGLTVGGTFIVDGKATTFTDASVEWDASTTIAELLEKEILADDGVTKIKLSEFMSFDETTGKFSIDKHKGAAFSLKDGAGGNFLALLNKGNDTLTGNATLHGDTIIPPPGTSTAPDTSVNIAGQNAVIEVDGLTIERSNNAFNYEGINLELVGKGETTINISNDTTKIFDTIKKFVEDYNKLIDETNSKLNQKVNRDYKPLTPDQMAAMSEKEIDNWDAAAKSGVVRGDSMLTNVISELRNVVYQTPAGSELSLYDLGITTGSYLDGGKLVISEELLKKRLDENPDSVGTLFANYNGDGLIQKLDKVMDDAVRTTGVNKGYLVAQSGVAETSSDTSSEMSKSITKLDERIKELQKKYKAETTALYSRFSSLETYMNNMNQQASWLSQQFQ